ncbi:MAG: Arm DNA-binding domain-containing protein [Bacteroidales bacterium]|nr:Arm DNA-binding domain-containing protein [Bacteroidales bacterium]
MRSTFKMLFYVNGSKEKNGIVPIMGRVTINGSVAQFSCKQSIHKDLWDVKGNKAKGKSKEARDDFIIEKQRAEFERIEVERQHKKHQIDFAEQELKQVKPEIRTDKLKSVATDAATALASGVSSLFGSGKMKSLERKNEDLRDEIAIRDEAIGQLQSNIKQMQVEHSRAMMNKDNEHRKALEAREAELKEETNTLNSIINTAHRWYPDFANLLRLERLAKQIGLSAMEFAELIKGKILNFTGRLFSSEHNRWFATDNTSLQILRDNDKRLTLTANRIPISQ